MAHQVEELRALALELVERREILHGHHHREHRAVAGRDRGDVDQRADAPPVGHRDLELLAAHRLGEAQRPRYRAVLEDDLRAPGEAAAHHAEQALKRYAGHAQAPDHPLGLAVDRLRAPARAVEHQHADRRGLDQRLEVRARPLLVAVEPGVGDRAGRGRGEGREALLRILGESLPLRAREEADRGEMGAAVAQRQREQGLGRQHVRADAERAERGSRLGRPQHARTVAQVRVEPRPVRPLGHAPLRCLVEAGARDVDGPSGGVHSRDEAPVGAAERAGAGDDLAQHRGELKVLADAREHRLEVLRFGEAAHRPVRAARWPGLPVILPTGSFRGLVAVAPLPLIRALVHAASAERRTAGSRAESRVGRRRLTGSGRCRRRPSAGTFTIWVQHMSLEASIITQSRYSRRAAGSGAHQACGVASMTRPGRLLWETEARPSARVHTPRVGEGLVHARPATVPVGREGRHVRQVGMQRHIH